MIRITIIFSEISINNVAAGLLKGNKFRGAERVTPEW
jgi:hypothetical protein